MNQSIALSTLAERWAEVRRPTTSFEHSTLFHWQNTKFTMFSRYLFYSALLSPPSEIALLSQESFLPATGISDRSPRWKVRLGRGVGAAGVSSWIRPPSGTFPLGGRPSVSSPRVPLWADSGSSRLPEEALAGSLLRGPPWQFSVAFPGQWIHLGGPLHW